MEKATNRADEPTWKTLGGEDFEDEIMLNGIESLCIVRQQDEELLVGAPLGIELGVDVPKVLCHKTASDKTLLGVIQDSIDSRGDEDNESEGNETIICVIDAQRACIID